MLDNLAREAQALSSAELVAVILAIAYLLLVIRQNIWCWFCAAISSALYVWLFIGAKLYMESLLYLFYVLMAIYGYLVWMGVGRESQAIAVTVWSPRRHIIAITVIVVFAGVTGWWLSKNTDAAYPYVDSATTFAAIWATLLVARKVLENWWYWLVIDVVSVFIYWSRGLEATTVLFVLYVVLIPIGLITWTRSYRKDSPAAVPA